MVSPALEKRISESVIAKLIYSYRIYQNAFEKSSKDVEIKTTPGLM